MTNVFSICLAVIAGAFLALQGSVNSWLGKTAGQFAMIIGVSAVQILLALGIMIFKKMPFNGILNPWVLFSGALGVIIMYGISYTVSSIGALQVFVLALLGQIIASTVIDHFGLFGLAQHPVNLLRIASSLVVLAGVVGVIKSS